MSRSSVDPSNANRTNSELRNRIYHFAAKPSSDIPKSGNGAAIGLTQVCRQIRSEFRDTYLRESTVGVKWTCIARFIDAFYPAAQGENLEEMQNCPSHIHVLVRVPFGVGPDLLPLVKMKVAHPQLQFSVEADPDIYKFPSDISDTCTIVRDFLDVLIPSIVQDVRAMKLTEIYYRFDDYIFVWYKPNATPDGVQRCRDDITIAYFRSSARAPLRSFIIHVFIRVESFNTRDFMLTSSQDIPEMDDDIENVSWPSVAWD